MPNSIGHRIIRRSFKFTYDLPEDLVFKIAETTDEIEQAFRVIHDGFVESKLMNPNNSKLRITKFYCLPTTTLMICKHKNEVIATISLIGDSAFGLPTEEFRDLSEYRNKGLKLAEISGLAIKKNNQEKRGKLLLVLFKFMYEYAKKHMRADALVISTAAEVKEFYRALFDFKALDDSKVLKFSTVNNRETVSQITIIKESSESLEKHYKNISIEKNLHYFFEVHTFKQFNFPTNKYSFTIDPIFTPEQMKHFFTVKTNILEKMNEKEKILLAQYYPQEEFKNIIWSESVDRKAVRTPSSFTAFIQGTVAEVVNVSNEGLKLKAQELKLSTEEPVELLINLYEEESIKLKARVMWVKDQTAGLKLDAVTKEWMDMIDHAHRLYRPTSVQ